MAVCDTRKSLKGQNNMDAIDALEQQIATREQVNSSTLLRAYIATQEAGNELLDFSEYIFDTALPGFTDELDSAGVTEFTISARQSDMAATLIEITEQGWELVGLTRVLERFTDFSGNRGEVPAFHLRRA